MLASVATRTTRISRIGRLQAASRRDLAVSQYSQPPPVASPSSGAGYSGWAGWVAFAGALMVMLGIFAIIEGLVAIFSDKYFLVPRAQLVVSVDYSAWGWLHMALGVIVLVAGVCVFAGQIWARTVGVLVALVSAVVNIAFLSAYPVWSVIMITLDVIVILALTVHGSEMRATNK